MPLRLPILKLFYKPGTAFRELAANSPVCEVFFLLIITTLAESFLVLADFVTPTQHHMLARGVRLLWHATHVPLSAARYYSFLTVPYYVATLTLFTLPVFGCVKMLGSSISFKTFWTGSIFIAIPFILPAYFAESIFFFTALLGVGNVVLLIWMIHVFCHFSLGRALVSVLLSFVLGIGAMVIVLIAGLFAVRSSTGLMQRFLRPPAMTSVQAPADYDWAAQSLDGKPVKMDRFQHKVVVLNFWATWCGPCVSELPSLQRLHDRVKDQGIIVMAISEEPLDRVQHFLEGKHFTFPIFVRYQRMPMFQSTAIPVTFILSRDGTIVRRQEGAAQWDSPETISFLENLNRGTTGPVVIGASGSAGMNLGLNDRSMALVLNNQAQKLIHRHQYAKAKDYLRQGLRLMEKDPKPQDAEMISVLQDSFGTAEAKDGHYPDAEAHYHTAIRILEASPTSNKADVAMSYHNLAVLYRDMHRKADAQQADAKSKELGTN